ISRLCREKKIAGTRIGRNWFIEKSSLVAFVDEQEREKKRQAKELSRTREKEYRQSSKEREKNVAVPSQNGRPAVPSPYQTTLRSPAFAVLVTLLALNAGIVLSETDVLSRASTVVVAKAAGMSRTAEHSLVGALETAETFHLAFGNGMLAA